MPALHEVQQCVMQALTRREDAGAAAALLRSGAALSAQQRLQIYRNNVFETRIAALAAVYPVVERLVGTKFFRSAARAYIQIFPSLSGDLRAFGRCWPQFLREYVPAAGTPYLHDVAELEWAYHHAYHAVRLPPLDPAPLARLSPADQARLCLRLQPSAMAIRSPYPVLRIWLANQPQAPDADAPVRLDEGEVRLLVVQRDLEVEFRSLDDAECQWLCALACGLGLGEATQEAFDRDPDFDLAAVLGRNASDGLFVEAFLPT